MYQKILIATDGSELSDKAVDSGLRLAALSGAAAIVVKVVRRYPRSYMDGAETLDAREAQRVEADWTAHAERELDAIKARGQELKASVSTEVLHSDLIAESIISAAKLAAPAAGQRDAARAHAHAYSGAGAALMLR